MDMMWYRRRGLMVTSHIERVTGAIASFNSVYNKIPIKSLICDIETIQEGTGDPSPENVRPISGRTGLNVARTRKNLLPNLATAQTKNGVSLTPNADGSYTVSGTATATTIFYLSQYGDRWKTGRFKLTGCPEGGGNNVFALRVYSSGGVGYATDFGFGAEFDGAEELRAGIVIWNGVSINKVFYPMISFANSVSGYEPYKRDTYSVNWETEAGSVYGGTLDVVSGKLVVDHAKSVLNGSETWAGNSNEWYTPKHDMARLSDYTSSIKSDRLKTVRVASVSSEDWHITGYVKNSSYPNENWIYIKLSLTITTSQELKNWLSENPVEYIYPLATPTEIQLTPQEVRTLLGENNIWSDSGNVTVDYWKWG